MSNQRRVTRRDPSRPPPDAKEDRHAGDGSPSPDDQHDPLSGGDPDRGAIRCSVCTYHIANDRARTTCPMCGHSNFRGQTPDSRG